MDIKLILISILSNFEATFWILPHHHPHDQYARGVVVCSETEVSHLAYLLYVSCFACLFACLLASVLALVYSLGLLC